MSRPFQPHVALALLACILLHAGAAGADDAGVATTSEPVAAEEVTRRDVARSLQAFEAAFMEHQPQPPLRDQVVRQLDWIGNLIVFRGALAPAVREFDALADAMRPPGQNTPADRAARALRLEIFPPVLVVDPEKEAHMRIALRRLYVVEGEPTPLELRMRRVSPMPENAPPGRGSTTSTILSTGALQEGARFPPPLPGHYVWELATPGGNVWPCGEYDVLDTAPDVLCAELLERLEAIDVTQPALLRSARAARSRVNLLRNAPDPARPASFMANLYELSRQLREEVAALERGQNPYERREGDYWRTIDIVAGPPLSLPARVYAPASAIRSMEQGRPATLVIVLHGAGGDENYFMDAYGAGEIKRQAEALGFVVVSPATLVAMSDLRSLGAMVDAMAELYNIDPERVLVVGHSLGAITAGLWAGQQPERIAGVGLIAGGQPDLQLFPAGDTPVDVPAFVVAAEHDTIFPPDGVAQSAAGAARKGATVAFRRYEDEGHVSIVPASLSDVLSWLLEQTAE